MSDKNWQPPTLESSIEYLEYEISKNPFGVPAFEGFILESLKELKEIKEGKNETQAKN